MRVNLCDNVIVTKMEDEIQVITSLDLFITIR